MVNLLMRGENKTKKHNSQPDNVSDSRRVLDNEGCGVVTKPHGQVAALALQIQAPQLVNTILCASVAKRKTSTQQSSLKDEKGSS